MKTIGATVMRCAFVFFLHFILLAEDGTPTAWPRFRGPNGSGVTLQDGPAPTHFGPGTNPRWVANLPPGHSSPCIWDRRIFLTGYETNRHLLETICLDQTTGKVIWRREVPQSETWEQLDPNLTANSYASPTPVTDGKVVVSYFGSYGLLAYNYSGDLIWRKTLPRAASHHGAATSPIIVRDLVVLDLHLMTNGGLLGLKVGSGEQVWKAPLRFSARGWATPVVWQEAGEILIGTLAPGRFTAHRFKDGTPKWWFGGVASETSASPVVGPNEIAFYSTLESGDDTVFRPIPTFDELIAKYDQNKDGRLSTDEFPDDLLAIERKFTGKGISVGNIPLRYFIEWDAGGKVTFTQDEWQKFMSGYNSYKNDIATTQPRAVAVRLGGTGDVTSTHLVWEAKRGVPDVASPLLYRGRIYFIRNGGILVCRDASTGRTVYQERIGASGGYYSSPVATGGNIYTASDRGRVTVIAAGDSFRVVARNDFDEPIFSTPALVQNALYIRTLSRLYAFENQPE